MRFKSCYTEFFRLNKLIMQNSKNPLEGITLEKLLTELVNFYGWEALGQLISIRCFTSDPSIKSSLKFLRKKDWARDKVEKLFIEMKRNKND